MTGPLAKSVVQWVHDHLSGERDHHEIHILHWDGAEQNLIVENKCSDVAFAVAF